MRLVVWFSWSQVGQVFTVKFHILNFESWNVEPNLDLVLKNKLSAFCESKGLLKSGTKDVLIDRIKKYFSWI